MVVTKKQIRNCIDIIAAYSLIKEHGRGARQSPHFYIEDVRNPRVRLGHEFWMASPCQALFWEGVKWIPDAHVKVKAASHANEVVEQIPFRLFLPIKTSMSNQSSITQCM